MSETERAVLGVVMNSPQEFHNARALGLVPEHFGTIRNKRIWKAFVAMSNEGVGIDLITVRARLEEEGALDLVGGIAYLSGLDMDLPDPGHLKDYVDAVKAASIRRKVVEVGKHFTVLPEGVYSTNELMGGVHKQIHEIVTLADGGTKITSGAEAINDLVEQLEDGVELGLKTGYDGLDIKIGGVRPGNFVVLAGRPAMGKTALALNIAHIQMSGEAPSRVGIFSLEMSAAELATRLLAAESRVPLGKIRMGALGQEDWNSIAAARSKISKYPLLIEDSGGLTLEELVSKARELHNVQGLDIIFIDYIQLMSSGRRSDSRQDEVSQITRGLKMLAKDLGIPIIAVSQLSREVEKRRDKRPQLSDLRESGSIEQDADVVIFVFRPGYYKKVDNTNGVTELIMAKNRSGPAGTVQVVWDPTLGRFLNQ